MASSQAPVLGVAVKRGRHEWWLYVVADGKNISGAVWSRPTEAEARAAGPALLEHWRRVSIDVFGSEAAGIEAGLLQFGHRRG